MDAMGGSLCSKWIACAVLVTGLTAAGCAAEESSDEVNSSSDAVISGTETFERPEVGIVWHGGGLCTGTLIRPNVVLTAAHCVTGLPKDEDATHADPPYAFEIRSATDKSQRFPVVRVHSVLAEGDFDGSQAWRKQDIALLRLASDVPTTLARPAAVAHSWPAVGASVALFGYGCTSRTPGANGRRPGSGTKRTMERTWTVGAAFGWTTSNNVCPGDSGGPLLDQGRSAVIGTNSGYVGTSDHFGDVPANHVAVEAIADRWLK